MLRLLIPKGCFIGFVLALAITLAVGAGAQELRHLEEKSRQLKKITEALRSAGLHDLISELPFAYSLAIQRQSIAYSLTNEQQAELEAALLDVDQKDLERQLSGYVFEQLSEQSSGQSIVQSIDPILVPLQQDIVERFRRFERIAGSPQQVDKMHDFIYWLENEEPLEEQRRKLLRNCLLASGGHRMAALLQSFADVDTAVAYDVVEGAGVAINDPEGVKLWRRELEQQLAESFAANTDSYLAFSYQFIRDQQLQTYATLWQDRNVQWFIDTSLKGLRVILRERRYKIVIELYQKTIRPK